MSSNLTVTTIQRVVVLIVEANYLTPGLDRNYEAAQSRSDSQETAKCQFTQL